MIHANTENRKAVLFVHGLWGDARDSFAAWPCVVFLDTDLRDYDVWLFDYASNDQCRPIAELAGALRGFLRTHLSQYSVIDVVAHSLGGVIMRRALVDALRFEPPRDMGVRTLFLLATPNSGYEFQTIGRHLPVKCGFLQDLSSTSEFMTKLNSEWSEFTDVSVNRRAQPILAYALFGNRDTWVSPASAIASIPRSRILPPFENRDHQSLSKVSRQTDLVHERIKEVLVSHRVAQPTPRSRIGVWVARHPGDGGNRYQRGLVEALTASSANFKG